MRNTDVPWLAWMDKNMVTSFGATQYPTICFQLLDQVFAVYGGYRIHQKEFCNLRLLAHS